MAQFPIIVQACDKCWSAYEYVFNNACDGTLYLQKVKMIVDYPRQRMGVYKHFFSSILVRESVDTEMIRQCHYDLESNSLPSRYTYESTVDFPI